MLFSIALIAVLFGTINGPAAGSQSVAEVYAAEGRAAAADFPGIADLCNLEMAIRTVDLLIRRTRPKNAERPQRPVNRQRTEILPTKVFDDLYFLGTGRVSAWLYGTEEGYILIDALTSEEEAAEKIIGGIKRLGLDPKRIRYLLITHGHGDHYGGANYLARELDLRIAMSDEDWRLTEKMPPHPKFGPAPARDMTVADGDVIKAGKTTLEVHLTPGHTLGTVSPIFAVHDRGTPHRVALWGGTGFNFGEFPDRFRTYAASAASFRDRARARKVDVFLSNHPRRDNTERKLAALAARTEGDPHPFVIGRKALDAFTVLEKCALAQSFRFSGNN